LPRGYSGEANKKVDGGGKNQTPKRLTLYLEPSLEQHQISPSLSDISISLLLPSLSYITKTVLKLLFFCFSLLCRDLWRLGRTAWHLKLLMLNHRVSNSSFDGQLSNSFHTLARFLELDFSTL
jgi:hypothetical protein